MRNKIRSLIAIVLIIAFFKSYGQTIYQVTVDSKFRTGAGTKFKSIGIIKNGEKVNVLEQTNAKWTKVEHNSKTGYISSKNLAPYTKALPAQQETIPAYNDKIKTESSSTSIYMILLLGGILIFILVKRKNEKARKKSISDNLEQESQIIKFPERKEENLLAIHDQLYTAQNNKAADYFSSDKSQTNILEISALQKGTESIENNTVVSQNNLPNGNDVPLPNAEIIRNECFPKMTAQEFRNTISGLINQLSDSILKESLTNFNRVNLGYIDLAKARFELLELQNKTTIRNFNAYIEINGEIIWTDQYQGRSELLSIGQPLTRNDYYNKIIIAVSKRIKDLHPTGIKPLNTGEKYIKTELTDNISAPEILGTKQQIPDPSIVDVIESNLNLNIQQSAPAISSQGVPVWKHQYVYSANEINYATEEQKRFYNNFKYRFLKGDYLNLEGNNNYSFILLFDLIDDYANHRNLPLAERQIEEIGNHYPITKYYGTSSLIKKLEILGDRNALEVIKSRQNNSTTYPDYNHNPNYSFDADYWGLGTKNKSKHSLTDDEVDILNKIWNPSNNFYSIEFCANEILKLFVSLIRKLSEEMLKQQTNFSEEVNQVVDIVLRKHFRYKHNSYNYKSGSDSVKTEIYSNIFKRCENAVREKYSHKRKLNTDTYITSPEAKTELESRLFSKAESALPLLATDINLPDEKTEIELNAQNTTRWKQQFEELTEKHINNSKLFIEAVLKLGDLNSRNPAIENIFYDASKFLAKQDKEGALDMYVYYLYHDLKSANFDNKKFTKTVQKCLFSNNEQLHNFEKLVSDLIKDRNLQKALDEVPGVYAKKRRKIQLDMDSIKEVQVQHSGTVELLNEYLQDKYEDENNIIKAEEAGKTEIKIEVSFKNNSAQSLTYVSGISLTDIQVELLELFVKNNFAIQQSEVELFAKSKSVFKNQLIESINDSCFEQLDDVLIEEDDESYTINQNYYNNLLAV